MTLDELEALSDKELQIRAAELDGWTELGPAPHVLDKDTWGMPPVGKRTIASVWNLSTRGGDPIREPLPDYLHKIAAVWELVESAKQHEPYPWLFYLHTSLVGTSTWFLMFEQPVKDGKIEPTREVRAFAERTERAILLAYILAMTEGEDAVKGLFRTRFPKGEG